MIGVQPWILEAVIKYESGGNPLAVSKDGKAFGLIQFRGSSIKEVGFESGYDLISKYSTFDSQIYNPVARYLYARTPFLTAQSFLMSIFYPAYRYMPEIIPFPAVVRSSNPGINLPLDYINRVYRIGGKIYIPQTVVLLTFFVARRLWKKTTRSQ